jgi:hypothetical protein
LIVARENLSRDPKQIRTRLRRRGVNTERDIAMYVEEVWKKPIEEWDLEELAYGRPRNKNGTFQGRSPRWVTPAVQKEAKRRLMTHTYAKMGGLVDKAIKVMLDLMESDAVDDKGKPIVDARVRLAAAQFIVEHVVGKPKALVEIEEAGSETRTAIAAAIVLDDGQSQDHHEDVVDAELVEDEDDGDFNE